jgi:hypothetical protein
MHAASRNAQHLRPTFPTWPFSGHFRLFLLPKCSWSLFTPFTTCNEPCWCSRPIGLFVHGFGCTARINRFCQRQWLAVWCHFSMFTTNACPWSFDLCVLEGCLPLVTYQEQSAKSSSVFVGPLAGGVGGVGKGAHMGGDNYWSGSWTQYRLHSGTLHSCCIVDSRLYCVLGLTELWVARHPAGWGQLMVFKTCLTPRRKPTRPMGQCIL